ncbi:MAG TPA: EamA family transporter [Mycobacteriales bacterium]|nr:EamA family transporter [Mycobacteriales bacterium]
MAFLALLASLLWGTADYLGGVLTRRRPALVVVLAMQVTGLVAVAALAAVRGAAPVGDYLWYAAAAGAAGAMALTSFYQALAIGTMGVVAPVAATGVGVPVVVSWLRGERPAAMAAAGLLLAAAGVVLSSGFDPRNGRGRSSLPATGLAAVAAVGFGSVLVLVDRAADQEVYSTPVLLVVMRATTAVVVALVLLARRGPVRVARADLPALCVTGLCDVAAVGLYAVASTSDADLAVVAVLASLYPVVTALIARRLLAERLSRVQVGGVVTVLVGVSLIAGSGAAA